MQNQDWPDTLFTQSPPGLGNQFDDDPLLAALVAKAGRQGVDPDDAARCVDAAGWKALHEPARRAARRLVAAGVAELVQGGRVVDPSTAKGDVRVRAV